MKYIKIYEELDFSKLNPKKWTKREKLKSKIKNMKVPNVSEIEIKDIYSRGIQQNEFEVLFFLKNSGIKIDSWSIEGVAVRLIVNVWEDTLKSGVVVFIDNKSIPERVRYPQTGIFSTMNMNSKYGFNIWVNGFGGPDHPLYGHTIGKEFEDSIIISSGGRNEDFDPKDIESKISDIFQNYIPSLIKDIKENTLKFLNDIEKKIGEHKKKSEEVALKRKTLKENKDNLSDIFWELEEISTNAESEFKDDCVNLYYNINGLRPNTIKRSGSSYYGTVEIEVEEANFLVNDILLKVFKIVGTAKKRMDSLMPGLELDMRITKDSLQLIIFTKK
jgi:hypothetical protein